MALQRTRWSCCKAAAILVCCSVATAQEGLPSATGVVSGSGTALIKKSPHRLRLQIDLLAKAKNLPEALTRLKDRREAVTAQLKTLGATTGSIEFGESKIQDGQDNQQQMLSMMIRQRMAAGRAKGKAKPVGLPVTVTVPLKAEWELNFANTDELLTIAYELQEKIKAADLAGTKEAEQLTPEEQELSEEQAAAEQMQMYGQQENKPGTPVFLFVAAISDKERAAATAEAFTQAKEQAGRLAEAAKIGLGGLRTLNSHSQMADDGNSSGNNYAYQIMRQQMAFGMEGEEQKEAVGTRAGTLSLQVVVTASFDVK